MFIPGKGILCYKFVTTKNYFMVDIRTIHIIVSGKVQGVYFRASCVDTARKLGIGGWVRNMPDKRVEIMASGGRKMMDEFINWCGHGPSGAQVDEVLVEEKAFQPFENFTILRG